MCKVTLSLQDYKCTAEVSEAVVVEYLCNLDIVHQSVAVRVVSRLFRLDQNEDENKRRVDKRCA